MQNPLDSWELLISQSKEVQASCLPLERLCFALHAKRMSSTSRLWIVFSPLMAEIAQGLEKH